MIVFVSVFGGGAISESRPSDIYRRIDAEKIYITTDFIHNNKKYREKNDFSEGEVVIHVPCYSTNMSIRRMWSHLVFAYKLKKVLKSLPVKPKAVYCAMPTSSSAYVCARYCKTNKIKFVIDVVDLWPDSLIPISRHKALLNVLLSPWSKLTAFGYRSADVILGESVAYANEASKYNSKASVYPLYLGINMGDVCRCKAHPTVHLNKQSGEVWIAYAGTLKASNGLMELLKAVRSIHGLFNYKLWFVGDGVERPSVESYIDRYELNAEITGFCSHDELWSYLLFCDIAVNIFQKGTKVAYSYKFNDYVGMDCFILNSLEGETAQMIDEYKVGRNFNYDDNSLSDVLKDTLDNWEYYSKWKGNTQKLIEEKLDKSKIYSEINGIFANR